MRKISVLLLITLILSCLSITPVFAADELILSGNSDTDIVAGKSSKTTLRIKNTSESQVTDVKVSVYDNIIYAQLSETVPSFKLEKGETKTIVVDLYAETGIGSINRNVTVDMQYTIGGVEKLASETFRVSITDTPSTQPSEDNRIPNVVMMSPTSVIPLPAGSSKTIDVILKNSGNTAANNLTITPAASKDLRLTMTSGTNSMTALTVNNTLTTRLTIAADKDLKADSYPVVFNYTYYDANKKQYTGTSTFYVKVENEESTVKPNLILRDFKISPDKVIGGDQFTITAVVENTSTVSARNAQVTIGGLNAAVISMSNASNNTNFDTIASKATKTISFTLMANEKLKTNSYPITLTLKYKNNDSAAEIQDFTNEYTYYIGVTNKDGAVSDSNKAVLALSAISSPSNTYDTGQEFPISMTITNNGKLTAKNVKITAAAPEGVVPKSANVQQIMTLASGESKVIDFSFAPNSASKTQNYTIEFKVEYENGIEDDTETGTTKQIDSFVQYAGVNVVNSKADEEEDDEDKAKSIPKIIISSYKVDPIIVQAGQEFDLHMTFKNTHLTKPVNNIKALLTVPLNSDGDKTANVFSPVDASNTFYVDSIAPKGTSDQYVRLFTVPDAAAKNYVLVVEFDYEDEEGNQIKQTEEVGVTVKQNANLELGDILMPTNANVNEPIYIDFSVQNTGKVTLNNLKIKVVGEGFRTSDAEVILGNFVSGSYDWYSGQFVPLETGELTAKVVVSYDEDTGEHVERIEEYKIQVADMPVDMEMQGDMQMGPDGQMIGPDGQIIGPDGMPIDGAPSGVLGFIQNNWIWIAVGAVVAVAAIAGGVIFYRKKKKGIDIDE